MYISKDIEFYAIGWSMILFKRFFKLLPNLNWLNTWLYSVSHPRNVLIQYD